jgi:L-lactate dehydrogenase complex protein LldG
MPIRSHSWWFIKQRQVVRRTAGAVRRYEGSMNAVSESFAIVEAFKTRAEAVSAQVERVASKESALELIVRLLRQEGVEDRPGSRAVWAESRMIGEAEKQRLRSAMPGLSFHVTRELAAEAKVGISQMDWALANTGTLVQTADAVDTRLVSTLPLLHIAMVSTAALLPDLPALLSRVDPRRSAYLSFITGPSRTADIERVLTIGVHGPARLIIVLVDDLEVAA